MEIFISIDGVIRNTIQKFDYHYNDAYLADDVKLESNFEYGVIEPIQNDNLLNSYKFESKEESDYFLFIEYPIEIFGHAGLSYSTTFSDLHKIIYENPNHNFTLIGLDELGKAKPATLFFLSKNGFLGNNIKFIKSDEVENNWNKCDVWITDNKNILDLCPEDKGVIKFNTTYNQHFTNKKEITKLTEIQEPWLNSLEKTTTLISTESQINVEPLHQ
jgi:predicted transcriptional regulator